MHGNEVIDTDKVMYISVIILLLYSLALLCGASVAYFFLGDVLAIIMGPFSASISLFAAIQVCRRKKSGLIIGFWNAAILGAYFTLRLYNENLFMPWGLLTLVSLIIVIIILFHSVFYHTASSASRRHPKSREKYFSSIGISVDELSKKNIQRFNLLDDYEGVVITDITKNTPAFQANLHPGDIIICINRKRVRDLDAFSIEMKKVETRQKKHVSV